MDKRKVEIHYYDSTILEEQTSGIAFVTLVWAIGYVLEDNEQYITIAREVLEIDDHDEFLGQLCIPKVAVADIIELK